MRPTPLAGAAEQVCRTQRATTTVLRCLFRVGRQGAEGAVCRQAKGVSCTEACHVVRVFLLFVFLFHALV